VKCRHRVLISTLSCEFLHLFKRVYDERLVTKKKMDRDSVNKVNGVYERQRELGALERKFTNFLQGRRSIPSSVPQSALVQELHSGASRKKQNG
jgi:hypothetical protein